MPAETLPQPAYCHGVVARLVEQPRDLACCHEDPRLPELDVNRLRQIAGFIAKVRHNPVRFRLPLTMRALAAAGLEIDFFAHHAPEFTARRGEGLTDVERCDLFVSGLQRWLDPADDAHRLVADVLAHELTMLQEAARSPGPAPAVEGVVGGDSRVRRRDGVEVLHLTVHPPDVADAALTGMDSTGIDRSRRCYAYVPTPAGPRVKSLEPALAPLLESADGRASVAEIAAAVDASAPVEGVAAVFQMLVRSGLADVELP